MECSPHDNLNQADLLLVNPVAGGGLASEILPQLREFAAHRQWNLEISITESPNDLSAKARRAAAAGRPRIFVLGGDGTFQVLLNAVAEYKQTILGVIPAGGGNDLAASLGFPPNPIRAAALLLDGEVCHLDVVRVRTADGNERLYSGGGGVGLDAQAALYANGAYRNLRGRLRYILAALRALIGFQPIRVQISTFGSDPRSLKTTALLVGVLNTSSYGAGVHLAPAAKTDDGILEVVALENLSVLQILYLFPSFASRGQLKTKQIRRLRATCLRIETDSPHWFQADGELLGLTPVDIAVVPLAVRVIHAKQQYKT